MILMFFNFLRSYAGGGGTAGPLFNVELVDNTFNVVLVDNTFTVELV